MINYDLDERFARHVGYGSLGMTDKYYKDQYWYKKNLRGYEGKAEAVCSMILDNSNIANYVRYEECLINNVPGCRSKNFLKPGENVVTFQRLYDLAYGGNLKNKVNSYSMLQDRVKYVIDFVYEYTGLDITEYLRNTLYFDYLTLDVDRHFFNLAVIQTENGWKESPLFDFGASFFSLQHVFKPDMTLEEKLAIMTPQPFASDFLSQAQCLGESNIKLDYEQINVALDQEPEWIRSIVEYQLEQCSSLFQNFSKHLEPATIRNMAEQGIESQSGQIIMDDLEFVNI